MTWLVVLILYAAFIVVFFAVKLNRDKIVPTSRDAGDEIEAIDFYWRPG